MSSLGTLLAVSCIFAAAWWFIEQNVIFDYKRRERFRALRLEIVSAFAPMPRSIYSACFATHEGFGIEDYLQNRSTHVGFRAVVSSSYATSTTRSK